MKYLFIDESINENTFVVGGILIENDTEHFVAYNQFKKQIKEIPLTRKQKDRITFEFKSTLLEQSFPKIKRKLLYKLIALNCDIVYSSKNLTSNINQELKQNYYIKCLSNIINNINNELIIVTIDELGNKKFENNVFDKVNKYENVKSITKDNSFNNKGLQFADNVVNIIRKHISKIDKNNFYELVAGKVKHF